jgi:hypothetical protein
MNLPANNTITPCLIKVAKRLCTQGAYAFLHTVILSVVSDAALLSPGADRLDSQALEYRGYVRGRIDGNTCLLQGPRIEIWNPCIVGKDCSFVIETPECNL